MQPSAAEQAVLDAVAKRFAQQDPEAEALSGGLGNRCWRLRDAGRDLVVRFGAAHAGAFGVDRGDELLAHSVAAGHGLAPEILWHEAATGLLVTEFVPGRIWSRGEARRPASAARGGAWLRTLHGLPVPEGIARVDFGARAIELGEALPPDKFPAPLRECAALQRRRLGGTTIEVLCHHDLHHLNIVDTGPRLVVLDWEYAGAGEPLMDLAGYAAYHDLNGIAVAALLAAYAGGEPPACRERFAAARWLFECVWLLWLETRRVAEGSESAELTATRRHLAARLGATPDA